MHGQTCWWPRDVCGFSHNATTADGSNIDENEHTSAAHTLLARHSIGQIEAGSAGQTKDATREEHAARIDELGRERSWCAKPMYVCKRCDVFFSDQDDVIEHSKRCRKTDTEWGEKHARPFETEGGSVLRAPAPTPPLAPTPSFPGGGSNRPNQAPLAHLTQASNKASNIAKHKSGKNWWHREG